MDFPPGLTPVSFPRGVEWLGLTLVVVVDLPADLAAREGRRVDVGVGHTGAERPDELVEIARGDALTQRADDVGCRDRPRHDGLTRRAGRARWLATAAAEERRDTSGVEAVTEVDVRGDRQNREPAVGQLVGDRLRVVVDLRGERAGAVRGDPRGLLVPGQRVRLHHVLVAAADRVSAAAEHDQRDEQRCGDAKLLHTPLLLPIDAGPQCPAVNERLRVLIIR